MVVCFRTDASLNIGSGHVMRCLVLADELKQRGADVFFICRQSNGDLINMIKEKSFPVLIIREDSSAGDAAVILDILKKHKQAVDWMVVDHYGLDIRWEKDVKPFVKNIMVIDDLADRVHECDLLLDQNFYIGMENRYDGLTPDNCRRLIGPKFSLLRAEFKQARAKLHKRNVPAKNILVFFGGSDITNETLKILEAIALLNNKEIKTDVVTGINNPHKDKIKEFIDSTCGMSYYSNINNISELMLKADMFIGAAGITTWERCCLGLASLVVSVAQNQVKTAEDMAKSNFLYYIGRHDLVSVSDIKGAIEYFFSSPQALEDYSRNSYNLVDGLGSIRCADAILG